MSRLLILFVLLALAAGLVWGLTAAGADESSPSPAGDKVTLRVGWTTDPDNLNPFVGIEQSSYELYHVAYDFLTNYGDEYLETQPGLAESWTTSEDGLTWTFKIRQGVLWSDGEPLTAEDVAFSFNYQKDLELTAFLSALDGIKAVTAPDDTTVVIECDKPKADILSMWVPIVPEHIWSAFKDYDEATKYLNEPPIVGSGPFQVVEREKGKFVRCVANEQYWGGKPKVDEIIFQVYDNQDTLAQDLKLGAIDLAINIPPAQVDALKGEEGLASEACSQKAFDYLSFNCYEGPSLGNPALKDVKFRQALNWAVDKDKLTALAYQTYADPASSIFEVNFYDPNLDWHWEPPADVAYTFDLEKAKQALADAGYDDTDGDGILNDPKNGGKNIKLRLWSRQESAQSQVMGKLITGWWEDLGLDIQY
jgi:peptide/nickel transport system substrate-binding protein